jgi:hypothetical protein
MNTIASPDQKPWGLPLNKVIRDLVDTVGAIPLQYLSYVLEHKLNELPENREKSSPCRLSPLMGQHFPPLSATKPCPLTTFR